MKIFFFLSLFFVINANVLGQTNLTGETSLQKEERMKWWADARFGMFIHWGLYALPAQYEWHMSLERLSPEEYQKYFDHFNPDLYDPREWARKAKAAGMKYAVITTKHHEGFNLFDSKYTNFSAPNTPAGKDLLREFVDAFRAEGLKIGFYYSLIDWHHSDFTLDKIHPQRPDDPTKYKEMNKKRDMNKYREFLHNQVREILTNYGTVDILWLDFSYPGDNGKDRNDWNSKTLLKMVRELQPNILLNDRLDLKEYSDGWDFTTPEEFKVNEWPTWEGKRIPWETCQTFSGSWGYNRDQHTWKSTRQLLGLLIESVSKGGNLLLNVGPTARGNFDERANRALENMGRWMKLNSRSIYHCTQAPKEFEVPDNCLLTYNQETNRLYIHLLEYPLKNFGLKGYKDKIEYAQFLHDASEIQITTPHGHWMKEEGDENDINLNLPVLKPDVEIPVIEIFLK